MVFFFKAVASALLASAAVAAPAPQLVHLGHEASPTFVRTISQPTVVHTNNHLAHNTVVRTFEQPSAVHTSHVSHEAAPAIVRTIAQPAVVHTNNHFVRTVPAAVHTTHHNVVAQPATTTFVRTAASPVTHVAHNVHHEPSQTIVRTAAVPAVVEEVEHIANPNYSFGYSVADVESGDAKTRQETRDGNVVTGSYTVADPDGRLRRVTYTADAINGFQATVTYDGKAGPVAIPIDAAPAVASVPFVSTIAAAAPVASDNIVVEARAAPAAEAEEDSATEVESVAEDSAEEAEVRSTLFNAATPFSTQVLRNGDLHAHHNIHTLAAAPAFTRTHLVHQPATLALGHQNGQFVRVANANHATFAATPFGLRAFPSNARFITNNGGFIRAIQPSFAPAGTTLVQHA